MGKPWKKIFNEAKGNGRGFHEFRSTIWTAERNGNIDKLFSWEVGARLKKDMRKISDSQ